MKKNTHPKYQKVLFVDSASGYRFVCGSTLQTDAKEVFEGVEYPVYYLSISSASHPFFTGSKGLVDSQGRVEMFQKRFKKGAAVVVPTATETKEVKSEAKAPAKPVESKGSAKPAAKAAAKPAAKAPAEKKAAEKPAKAKK